VAASTSRASDSVRDANHGRRIAAIRSRAWKRPASVEVVTRGALDPRERLCGARGADERPPLPRRQRDDHDAPVVARCEVVPERAVS
jgi:hypothetical protein